MGVRGEQVIVVGIDGSDEALAAVGWAAEEAARRGASLLLVAAVPWTSFQALGPIAMETDDGREQAFRAAREHLDEADVAACRTVPRDRVQHALCDGSPAAVLVERSEGASLLVVGDRGRGGFAGLLAGSVAVAVSAAARCPVVVVRGAAGPADAAVVLGVSGTADGDAAVAFAFEQAAERGAPLLAVRAWSDEVPGPAAQFLDRDALERNEIAVLHETLAPWRARYPDVGVRLRLVLDRPAAALVGESAGAQLVVVGTRGHGERVGTLLGSVSRSVVHHAHCPVAVLSGDVPAEQR